MRSTDTSWTEQLELWVTLGLCSLLVAIALIAIKTVEELSRAAALESRSHLRIAVLTRTISLLETERARGYARLINGQDVRTEPSDAARETLARHLTDLRQLMSDDPGQSANARVLQIIANRQMEQLSESAAGRDAAAARLNLQAELGLMTAVHAIASAIERTEQDSLAARSDQFERQRVRLLTALLILTGMAIAATLGAAWQLHRDIGRLRRDERTLRHVATHDALTGLANRRHFARQLRRTFQRSAKSGESFAVVLMDVDRFKRINDSFGHRIGDLVLRALAARLSEGFRDVDTVARVGGEEFGVILPGLDKEDAYQVAERVRAAIAAEPFNAGRAYRISPVAVTISMGVAAFGRDATTAPALMDAADRALYGAKQAGRNRVAAAGSA